MQTETTRTGVLPVPIGNAEEWATRAFAQMHPNWKVGEFVEFKNIDFLPEPYAKALVREPWRRVRVSLDDRDFEIKTLHGTAGTWQRRAEFEENAKKEVQ